MNEMTMQKALKKPGKKAEAPAGKKAAIKLKEHIVEIISDSGEGAQKCGQSLGAIAAQMGNGIWTTEIIPAEIRPPARSVAGASGNRIRIGSGYITNGGDETDLVVAFNEQVLLGRVRAKELKPNCTILLEDMWRTHADPKIVASYIETHDKLVAAGYKVIEIPMERECRTMVSYARRGKITHLEPRAGAQVITAYVPLAEMFGYATQLRSMSQGRATYTMQFDHYDEVPKSVAEEVISRARGSSQGGRQWPSRSLTGRSRT